jgi:hypothetical protein
VPRKITGTVIIVEILGGLGNQMFQYAMGKSIALKNGVDLKLDIRGFKDYEWHQFGLGNLSISASLATDEEIRVFLLREQSFLSRIKRKILNKPSIRFAEKNLEFDPKFCNIKNPAYLSGYWQSEKYFKEFSEVIRKELTVGIPPSDSNRYILGQIHDILSISLHIRRGNFVDTETVNKIHGTCSIEYYQEAIDFFGKRFSNPHFFIFSDDISWAKKNLFISHEHNFVDINAGRNDYEDLRLMYNCKHHIIANSTFSWWAAWLNPNAEKLIVAPKQWFQDKEMNNSSNSIIPEEWIRF